MTQNDVYRISCTGVIGASTAMVGLHFRLKTSTPEPNNAAFAAVANDVINIFRPVQDQTFFWRTWRAVQVRGGNVSYQTRRCLVTGGRGEEGTFTTSNAGNAPASEPLPHQCALVTTLRTGSVGRSYRGRTYCPALTELAHNSGVWSASTMTAITTAWATFMAEYGSTPAGSDPLFEVGIWSHTIASGCKPNKNPPYGMAPVGDPNPDAAYTAVVSVVPKSTVFTQRRRVAGVGI